MGRNKKRGEGTRREKKDGRRGEGRGGEIGQPDVHMVRR